MNTKLDLLSPLSQEVMALIYSAKQRAAISVNSEITLLYWQVGHRIHQEVLGGERADYGQQVIANLSKALTAQFGRGWSKRNLAQMVKFYNVFPDRHIVQTLSAQLSWSHFILLSGIDDAVKRDFYTTMTIQEHWSTRTLDARMGALLFERTAISKKPDETILAELTQLAESGQYHPDLLLKDPYVLDFLELNDRYLEKDLEDAILRDIEQFLLELGAGFSFVARQKRIQVDSDDFYIDLLFYNRKLKRLVAIDLKLETFKHSHKSQMELYLNWLKKYETEEGENPPLGIILCSGKKQEQIELLEMEGSHIHVAEYLTHLIDVQLLEQRLQYAITSAKQRLGSNEYKLGHSDENSAG